MYSIMLNFAKKLANWQFKADFSFATFQRLALLKTSCTRTYLKIIKQKTCKGQMLHLCS